MPLPVLTPREEAIKAYAFAMGSHQQKVHGHEPKEARVYVDCADCRRLIHDLDSVPAR